MSALDRLSAICCAWGGKIVLVEEPEWHRVFDYGYAPHGVCTWVPHDHGFHAAPATHQHGIYWKEKLIIVVRDRVCPGAIIHEMGHVFLDTSDPERSKEEAWLGWEIVLARQVGAFKIWDKQNTSYETAYGPWGWLDPSERRALIKDRIAYGKKIGIIDRRGRARPCR